MAFPRILIAVPLLALGGFFPAVGPEPVAPPPGAVGMVHEDFSVKDVTVHRGERLTFTNNSRYMHIIGPGRDGSLAPDEGSPVNKRVLMPTNKTYITEPFDVPGTYYITCPMHPEMTVKVVVTE